MGTSGTFEIVRMPPSSDPTLDMSHCSDTRIQPHTWIMAITNNCFECCCYFWHQSQVKVRIVQYFLLLLLLHITSLTILTSFDSFI